MILVHIILVIAGLILLIKGADSLVKSSASIAEKFDISDFVIGLVFVAIGTSIPELATGISASLKSHGSIVLGNIVGSNIANIGLVIGVAGLLAAIRTERKMLERDSYLILLASFLLLIFSITGEIGLISALIFLSLYIVYIIFLFETKSGLKRGYNFGDFIKYYFKFEYLRKLESIRHNLKGRGIKGNLIKLKEKLILAWKRGLIKDFIIFLLSLVALIAGSHYLIEEVIFFSEVFNISEVFIGFSLVAIGTSLPELGVVLAAVKERHSNIAIGNIVGSSIANILLVLSISSFFTEIIVPKATLFFAIPAMIIINLIFVGMIKFKKEIGKKDSLILLSLYFIIAFLLFMFL